VKLRLSTNQQLEWEGPSTTNVAALKKFIQVSVTAACSPRRRA